MTSPDADPSQHERNEPAAAHATPRSDELFARAIDDVTRMSADLRGATARLDQVIGRVQDSIAQAQTLVDRPTPYGAEVMVSLETISLSVRTLANRSQQIASAYVVLSSKSMADYAANLQKYVAEVVVSRMA